MIKILQKVGIKGTYLNIIPHTYDKKMQEYYNGEKTVSLISGAGKTGQLHVKG